MGERGETVQDKCPQGENGGLRGWVSRKQGSRPHCPRGRHSGLRTEAEWACGGSALLGVLQSCAADEARQRDGGGSTTPPAPAMLAFHRGYRSPLMEKGFLWKTSSFPCVIITHVETGLPVRLLGDGGAWAASSVTGSVGFSSSRVPVDPQDGLASCSPVVCGRVLLGSVLGTTFQHRVTPFCSVPGLGGPEQRLHPGGCAGGGWGARPHGREVHPQGQHRELSLEPGAWQVRPGECGRWCSSSGRGWGSHPLWGLSSGCGGMDSCCLGHSSGGTSAGLGPLGSRHLVL